MERKLGLLSLVTVIALTLPGATMAAPLNAVVEPFPDLRGDFSCSQLFADETNAATQGRISCFKASNALACVVGEQSNDGVDAAQKLANQAVVPSKDSRDTAGAMIVYADRAIIVGTTKGASRAQQKILTSQPYKKTDALVVPASEHVAGTYAKATIAEPVSVPGSAKYLMQDSNIIVGKNADGVTSFYAMVTPDGEDAVVHYIRNSGTATLKCSNVPAEILGRYLVAPGVVFLNK